MGFGPKSTENPHFLPKLAKILFKARIQTFRVKTGYGNRFLREEELGWWQAPTRTEGTSSQFEGAAATANSKPCASIQKDPSDVKLTLKSIQTRTSKFGWESPGFHFDCSGTAQEQCHAVTVTYRRWSTLTRKDDLNFGVKAPLAMCRTRQVGIELIWSSAGVAGTGSASKSGHATETLYIHTNEALKAFGSELNGQQSTCIMDMEIQNRARIQSRAGAFIGHWVGGPDGDQEVIQSNVVGELEGATSNDKDFIEDNFSK
ncbi:hypothetical protein DFH08DRAFT_822388 [Mycena albidolilacea]|uniref:Uncharacterized protein n=1 Tax=Mycena albidolilacea TaxID=1033008 RepID=A0AAD6Z9A7_9AGAR|nr:hypothetical protein DFH08DRAFT_822388 [Mycena albidolilacea]